MLRAPGLAFRFMPMFFKLCQAIFILEIGVASGKDMASIILRACRSHLIERFKFCIEPDRRSYSGLAACSKFSLAI